MNYIFYCIYNTQYLDGENRTNKTPWFNAFGLMVAGSASWLMVLFEISYFYILKENIPAASMIEVLITCVILFIVHYYSFIKDKKYERIYERYKLVGKKKPGMEKLIAILYIIFPGIAGIIIAMLWHHVI